MLGLMMAQPLLLSGLLEYAASVHADREIVSYRADGPVYRGCYRDAASRTRRLANALRALGVRPGDRVATLASSTHRHLEIFYATAGIGAICHTINPRLHADQIAFIAGQADDVLVCADPAFLAEAGAAVRGGQARAVVLLGDGMADATAAAAAHGLTVPLLHYEDLLDSQPDVLRWPELDENTAAGLCYTSGTTGEPRGVLYSHRSQILHAYAVALPDVAGISEADSVLPVAPMFHVQSWGLPYAATLAGARLVLPGPRLHGAALAEIIAAEGVTIAVGVPTLWVGLIRYLRASQQRLPTLRRVIVGGAACPPALITAFQQELGIEVRQAWGMTEMSPLGTIATLAARHRGLPEETRTQLQAKQGRPVFGVELRIDDEAGRPVPHDGHSIGEIKVRGPWVCSGYFRCDAPGTHDAEGWFATGDLGTIDGDGFIQITDRRKDLIKFGGEWVSSIEIENLAMEHPAVMQAAAIGIPDEKWGEKPLLLVVAHPGSTVDESELLALYKARVAKWCVPTRILCVASLPTSATGKVQKNILRATYAHLAAATPTG